MVKDAFIKGIFLFFFGNFLGFNGLTGVVGFKKVSIDCSEFNCYNPLSKRIFHSIYVLLEFYFDT